MTFLYGDTAGDGFENNRSIYTHPPGRVETFTRIGARDIMTTSTGVSYFTMIFLEKGFTVTNLGCYVGSTAAGTPTSSWLGLWSHPTYPTLPTTQSGGVAINVYSSVRTATSPNITIATGTYPMELAGRLITGTGIPGATRIVSQTTTTLVLSANASASGTSNLTVGQFSGARQNIAFTTNGATAAIPANAAYTRPLTTAVTVPTSGLYMASVCIAATTMPTLVAMVGTAAVPLTYYSDPPAWGQSHAGPNNTAPGTNPATTVTDLRGFPYLFAT